MLFVFPKLITESRDTLSWEGPKRISESSSCPAQDTPKNPTESFFQALPELWQSWIRDYSPGEPGKSLHSLSLCPPACKILGIWTHSQPLFMIFFLLPIIFLCPIPPFLQQLQPSVILSQCPEGGGDEAPVFQVLHSSLWSDLEQES